MVKKSPTPRTRGAARVRTPGTAAKPVVRRWTPPEAFKPLIVSVLEEAGGELETDELFLELEIVADERLLPGDRETTPGGRAAVAVCRPPCAAGADHRGCDDARRRARRLAAGVRQLTWLARSSRRAEISANDMTL